MSLRGQPGYDPIELRTVIPIRDTSDPGEGEAAEWTPLNSGMQVISRKIGSGEAFREGKQAQTVSYTLYADHRRGTRFPFTEYDRLWHPDGSERLPDGTPNYETGLSVDSVLTHDREGIAIIECGREGRRVD